MSFNRRNEYKKFLVGQRKQTEEYRALGMSEEAIKEIQMFDKEQFLSDMRFYSHNQSLSVCLKEMKEESFNSLLKKYFDSLVVYQEDVGDWIDQIEDDDLRKAIKVLSEMNQTITKMLYDGYSIVQIAEILEIPKSTVGSKVKRVRLILLPYMSTLFPNVFLAGGDAE